MVRGRMRSQAALGLVATALAFDAVANNGLTLIGFGAESIGMAGADAAVARDTSALTTNPAGLSQLPGWAQDGYFATAFALDIAHADRFGNDSRTANWIAPVGGGGLSKQLEGTPFTVGVGLFAQAGAGNVYNDLQTPFGGRDTLRAQFGVLKITPGVAWQATRDLALGAALNVYYASLKQRVFPNTSTFDPDQPAQTYFGTQINDASTVRVGAKLGALYKPSPGLAIGVTYAPQVDIPFDNGELDVNLRALGLGSVTYRNVQLRGLALPQEVVGALAWQATPELLLALEVSWYNYARAIKSQSLHASDPDNVLAPPTIASTTNLDWRNQTVVTAGFAYAPDDARRFYGGVNYGRNPIPAQSLDPLLAVIGEWHLTLGYARKLDANWSVSAALEYLVPKSVTYDNPQLPFGPGAQERVSYLGVALMLSKRW